MGWKSEAIKPYIKYVVRKVNRWKAKPVEAQDRILKSLVQIAEDSAFGKEHRFNKIKSYTDFRQAVRLRDYEQFQPYIDRIISGEKNVLWPGKPIYFAKTSGTVSGMKYIPITKDSIDNHFYSAQKALMLYMMETGRTTVMDGSMIFLSGSPELEEIGGIKTGRLSGIVNHHIPFYLKRNQLPSYKTNCIEDWEEKVDAIVAETVNRNLTLISGIPPWVQMYFDKLMEKTGKSVKDIFPNFEMFVYGGVNFEPYRAKLEAAIGKPIPSIETYPASEGFIAFQDSRQEPGLLLNADSGIFYEFVPMEEIEKENPARFSLGEVEPGVNYAVIINSNAGLWGYNLGDTVKFISKDPYRLQVTGRVSHYISAFGEHVIAEEVERAMKILTERQGLQVVEFSVAPMVNTIRELPYHEWWVEFVNPPDNLMDFAVQLDALMCETNVYYRDLINGKVLQPLKIRILGKNAFINFMKDTGRLGGQNKVPRLSNNRMVADGLAKYAIKLKAEVF